MFDAQAFQSETASSSSAPVSISSANLRPFLDISPDALVIVDPAGTIVLVNGQTETFFGYARDELIGQPVELLLPHRYRAAHTAHRERYFSAPRTRPMGVGLQLVGWRKDGSEFPVEISLNPLLLDGALHALGAVRDMSAQRAAERVRLQQLQQIRLQADLLNLSHDAIFVRDPASRVTFWNKGAEELYGWTAQEALGRVSHALLKTRFPVATLLQQTTTRHQVEVQTMHEQLVADIDPGRIEQVLTNLIGNAVKYSPQGGPVIVTLWEEGTAGMVGISVQDRGIGIPGPQQAQIFGRFMRADNAVAWGISGTGLGLYICRELVQRHGGQLWFESAEGVGSTFFLTLPSSAD